MKSNARITSLRTTLGWSIERLAYESGLDLNEVRAIEAGSHRDQRSLSRIHNAFQAAKRAKEKPLPFAIPGATTASKKHAAKPFEAYRLSTDPKELVEQLRAMPPEEIAALKMQLLRRLRAKARAA